MQTARFGFCALWRRQDACPPHQRHCRAPEGSYGHLCMHRYIHARRHDASQSPRPRGTAGSVRAFSGARGQLMSRGQWRRQKRAADLVRSRLFSGPRPADPSLPPQRPVFTPSTGRPSRPLPARHVCRVGPMLEALLTHASRPCWAGAWGRRCSAVQLLSHQAAPASACRGGRRPEEGGRRDGRGDRRRDRRRDGRRKTGRRTAGREAAFFFGVFVAATRRLRQPPSLARLILDPTRHLSRRQHLPPAILCQGPPPSAPWPPAAWPRAAAKEAATSPGPMYMYNVRIRLSFDVGAPTTTSHPADTPLLGAYAGRRGPPPALHCHRVRRCSQIASPMA